MIQNTQTVRDIAASRPASIRVFQKAGIDFCCGGGRTLQEACTAANLDVTEFISRLEAAGKSHGTERDWNEAPLATLIDHILDTHHVYTRDELLRVGQLMEKVASKHGENHPQILQLRALFHELNQELAAHMLKEEQILFPYVRRMAENGAGGESCFGTVRNPVQVMMAEHDHAGELLRQMREVTGNYRLPDDACMSFLALYQGLEDLEKDLHQHIHLENNILFPGALKLENPEETASGQCCSTPMHG